MDLLDRFKEFVIQYKINLIIGGILLFLILISNFSIYILLKDSKEDSKVEVVSVIEEDEEEVIEKEFYKFDIKGAVNKPGVYKLEKGNRVIDAINIAGGLKANADTSVNNLSKYITDEMVIVIYTIDEVDKFSEIRELEEVENNKCLNYNEVITNDSCIEEEFNNNEIDREIDTKISLNTASIDLLITLPGIGEAKAKDIISYREEHGEFKTIEDIMNISGIGESLFEKIKDYITV